MSASGDCLIKLWDVPSGVLVREFRGHERGLACVQFDGNVIFSGSNDRSMIIFANIQVSRCGMLIQANA